MDVDLTEELNTATTGMMLYLNIDLVLVLWTVQTLSLGELGPSVNNADGCVGGHGSGHGCKRKNR